MTKLCSIILTIVITLTTFLNNAVADDAEARAIMKRVDARDDGNKSIMDMEMILIDKHGKKRIRTIRSFGIDQGGGPLQPDVFFLSGRRQGYRLSHLRL